MTLPASGSISLNQVNVELGVSGCTFISMNNTNVRSLFSVASGLISMSHGWGKSLLIQSGYWGGGAALSGGLYTNQIQRFTFSSETIATITAVLVDGRNGIAGVSSSTYNKGYFCGGNSATYGQSGEIDGVNFSNNTAINPTAAQPLGNMQHTGVSSTAYGKGFIAGGYLSSSRSEIFALTFSSESITTLAATLILARRWLGGISAESFSKGYFAGGLTASNTVTTEIDGINYSNSAALNPSVTISIARFGCVGLSSTTYGRGYFSYGSTAAYAYVQITDGVNYSNEAAWTYGFALATPRINSSGISSTTYNKGYFGGGRQPGGGTSYSEIDGVNFSNDAAINPSATLSVVNYDMGGVSTSGL